MLQDPLMTLKQFVDQPSCTFEKEDVAAVAELMAAEFRGLGFTIETIPGDQFGPKLVCSIGEGDKVLLLLGHMDTVFPREQYVPYTEQDDGTILGSGINDMKGGIMVMLYALKAALPVIDLKKYTIRAVLNPDEEVGSPESHDVILENAKKAFAVLSFEAARPNGGLTAARKGVTSVLVSCKGVPGHSGSKYLESVSAIQALCAQITKLYTLRDDAREISFNAGLISGGTAENVVAPDASCKCEFRYFNQAYKAELTEKIRALCADEPVPGAVTTLTFGPSHPAIDLNEKSQALIDIAQEISRRQGVDRPHTKTGGAGDISIAGQAGVGVLDGFGTFGGGAHTAKEFCVKERINVQIEFACEMIKAVCPA